MLFAYNALLKLLSNIIVFNTCIASGITLQLYTTQSVAVHRLTHDTLICMIQQPLARPLRGVREGLGTSLKSHYIFSISVCGVFGSGKIN